MLGSPRLVQNDSKINADTLIFEIANSKFIAQGNAHSEVISAGDDNPDPKAAPVQKRTTKEKKENKSIATAPVNKTPNNLLRGQKQAMIKALLQQNQR